MKNRLVAAFVLVGALLSGACGGRETEATAAAGEQSAAAAGGRIRGVVRLRGSAPPAAFEPVGQNQDVCGNRVPVTRLTLGKDGGIANAFVYLESVPGSSGPLRQRAAVPVEQFKCQYAPRAMALHAGTQLDIGNGDPILHNVHARQATMDGEHTIFNIAQPIRGQRTVVPAPLTKTGVVTLTCEAGHPWMSANILVADHPYTAVTDQDGHFTIPDVPTGTYRIRMWHEGIRLTRVLKSVQKYEFEPPYELTSDVVVTSGAEARADFALEVRPSS